MINFEYYSPTKVIFGKDVENGVGEEIKLWGGRRVLIHFSEKQPGIAAILERVHRSITEAGLDYFDYDGVVPNPRLSLVRKGVEFCKSNEIDFFLAIGGGSCIDSCKAMALSIANQVDAWEIYAGRFTPTCGMPVGVISTIAASGSETSWSSVITNEDGWLKRGYNTNYARPKFAMMNPELTYTLPPYQTACGAADIMFHTSERYFTTTEDTELVDRLSEALIKTVVKYGELAMKEPNNYNARAQLMWAGSISHNNLMGTGKVSDWSCHQIEHEIGGMFDVAHGAGLTAIWGSWARYVYQSAVRQFAQYAVRIWNCEMDFEHPENTAFEGILRTEAFFRELNLPTNLRELGLQDITEEQINELAYKATFERTRTLGCLVKLGEQEIRDILHMAK